MQQETKVLTWEQPAGFPCLPESASPLSGSAPPISSVLAPGIVVQTSTVREAVVATARTVSANGVRNLAVRRLLTAMCRDNCLSEEEANSILLEAKASRKLCGPHKACKAFLGAIVKEPRFNCSSGSLEFRNLLSGEAEEWRVTNVGDLQRDVTRSLGSLESLADLIHSEASPKVILRALQDIVPDVPDGEHADAGLEREDQPTRLLRALLGGRFFITLPGEQTRTTTTLAAEPGFYAGEGVGLRWDKKTGCAFLYVNIVTTLGNILRDHPEFGRGRMTPGKLARILRAAPGFVTDRERKAFYRQGRWWVIDVTAILAPDGRDEPKEPAEPADGE